MMLLDDALFNLWRSGKCTAADVLAKSQSPEDLTKRITDTEQGVLEDDDDVAARARAKRSMG